MERERRTFRRWAPLAGVMLLGAFLRIWRLGDLALIGDESYYWLWSRHLDWAYLDHPAGVAVLTWLSTALGGQSEVGIRWLNALMGTACIPLAHLLGAQMLSRRAGLLAASAVAVGAPFLLTSRFVYTDTLQLFLLLFNLHAFWRLSSQRTKLRTVAAFGLSLALLFNTKYSAYLYALALAIAVLLGHRHLLIERRFWLAALIAAIGLLPVVTWNAPRDWISFRWQWSHASLSLTGEHSLMGSAHHSLAYLTPPLAGIALLGSGIALVSMRRPAERLLGLVALFLLVPIALSPANSPRNLSTGLVALLLLGGARWPTKFQPEAAWRRRLTTLMGAVLLLVALYGMGTVLNLSQPSAWPHSSAVSDIRRDTVGWRELGPVLASYPEPIFALDYSIAPQIWYYGGQPAYTAWPQFCIWGIPPLRHVTVVSLDYLPEALVTERLRGAFQAIKGPRRLSFEEVGTSKEMLVWSAEELRLEQETFLQRFDFLTLLETAR